MSAGLALPLIEGIPQMQAKGLNLPAQMQRQCEAQNLPITGNAAGFNSTTNFAGLRKGPEFLETGWTPRAVGALTGCILTALCGMAAVVAYGMSAQEEEGEHEE